MSSKRINCPQCGSQLPVRFKYSKLIVCEHCGSTIFLEDQAVHLAGTQSVLSEEPSLIKLKQSFIYKQKEYYPLGHIRYDYGRGFWDEWWIINSTGKGYWMSVDEGDFAFEKPIEVPEGLDIDKLQLGNEIGKWVVTERNHAVCKGFEGELPEKISVGDEFEYIDLSSSKGEILSVEIFDGKIKAFQGIWVDPFEVKVQA